MSADINIVPATPPSESQSNISQKSIEVPSNNNESTSESHTPPLPEKPKSPQIKKRKSRFEDVLPEEIDKNEDIKPTEKIKQEEKQNSKKSNEWDMFAEADNIGDFNVCSLISFFFFFFIYFFYVINMLNINNIYRVLQLKENDKVDQIIQV